MSEIWYVYSFQFQYRDTVRQFIKGTDAFSGAFAECLCGSPNLYQVTLLLSFFHFVAHEVTLFSMIILFYAHEISILQYFFSMLLFKFCLNKPSFGVIKLCFNWHVIKFYFLEHIILGMLNIFLEQLSLVFPWTREEEGSHGTVSTLYVRMMVLVWQI